MNSRGPLTGLRVVDAADMRGALCGRLLADLGADVVMAGGIKSGEEDTFQHKFRNANKRSLGLDIGKKTDRKKLLKILESTDVFIENLGPQLQAEYGFSDLVSHDPNLVHISISDFGLSGCRSNWRLEPLPAFSSSGAHFSSGHSDLPPCWMSGYLAHDCASVFGAVGAVAAIMDRRRTESGQMVEVSVQEASLSGLNPWSIALQDYSRVNPLLPVKGSRNADITYWVLRAKDGWVRTVFGGPTHWRKFCGIIGNPAALESPEWDDLVFRIMNADVARIVCQEAMSEMGREELFQRAQSAGAVVGPIHTMQEFINHPQSKIREFFQIMDAEGMAGLPVASAPWKLEKSPAALRLRAPLPGQKDEGWLDEEDINFCPVNGMRLENYFEASSGVFPDSSTPASPSPSPRLLLEGVRVVEFGAAAVVPEMCWMLSELGAEVIKVESKQSPDVLRKVGNVKNDELGDNLNTSFAFNTECRGRKSVAINMSTPKGRELAFQLCRSADIVAENYRGSVIDKLGLTYEALSKENPRLIYVSSQGFGKGGPMAEVPAFGPVNFGFAGGHLLWNHSSEDLGELYPCGTSLNHPDHIAGKLLSLAVLSALDHRARTGQGQLIDMAQTEAAAYFMGDMYMEGEREAFGNQSYAIVPHNTYLCQGEDRWISIVAESNREFESLAQVLGMDKVPEKWSNPENRLKQRKEIDSWIAEWTMNQSPESVAEALQSVGVSAMIVQGPQDHHSDRHLAERGFIVELNHPDVGSERHVGNPMRMNKTEMRTAESSPRLGAHTQEVLQDILGMDPAEIAQLTDQKICW